MRSGHEASPITLMMYPVIMIVNPDPFNTPANSSLVVIAGCLGIIADSTPLASPKHSAPFQRVSAFSVVPKGAAVDSTSLQR